MLTALGLGAQEVRPNVVIFYTDDQGTLDVGCYGSDDLVTPNMDRLAREGVRFSQAYAHTVCTPSRAALLSGRHPQRSGMNNWPQGRRNGPPGRNLPLNEMTLAEVFQAAGYRTALFGKWHLGAHPDHGPLRHGFDEFFGIRGGFIDNYNHYDLHGAGGHDLYDGATEVFRRDRYFPDLICDRALSFVEEQREQPFFLLFSMNLPHYPEQPTAPYDDAYEGLEEPRRSYARVVSTCDRYLGRLLSQLDRLRLTDRTVVLFTSDNGHSEEDLQIKHGDHLSGLPLGHDYGAHGGGGNTGAWIGAKGGFLEGGIRVPAILRYPAQLPSDVVRDQPVTIMDWYPTLLDLAGVERPRDVVLDGRSVLPLVEDAAVPGRHQLLHWQWQRSWAVRQGRWKLIQHGFYGLGRPRLDPVMLVDLEEDRPERTNYAATRPNVVRRLRAAHDRWAHAVFPRSPR
ncbi:MAG: sulfatase-like hydrolase/transferase [Planctomycetota bacterium]